MTEAAAAASREDAGERAMRALLTAIAYGAPLVFILVPLILFLLQSFYSMQDNEIIHRFTLANYVRFFSEATFIPVFFYTCLLSLGAALITLVLGYPVALLLASLTGRPEIHADARLRDPAPDELHHEDLRDPQPPRRQRIPEPYADRPGIIDQPITFLIFNLYAVISRWR